MTATNSLRLVRQLAADEQRCEFFNAVFEELASHGLDSDELLDIIINDLGETHCFASKQTEKYFPNTMSDYYSIWVEECRCHMFLKLLVDGDKEETARLIITSFKRDDRHD